MSWQTPPRLSPPWQHYPDAIQKGWLKLLQENIKKVPCGPSVSKEKPWCLLCFLAYPLKPRMAVSYTPTLTTTTTTARAYFQILVPVWVVRPCARVTAHPARGLEGPPPVFPACGGVNAGRRAPGGVYFVLCLCVVVGG